MKYFILPLSHRVNNNEMLIHPVLLQQGDQLVLIDCGYPGFIPQLEEALAGHGFSLSQLTGLIITHHDIDHMGCAAALKRAYPALRLYAFEEEAPYVSGKKKSLRLQQAEALYHQLPEEQKAWARQFEERLKALETVEVDAVLHDMEEPAFLPGLRVIHTPGHLPGHISLFLEEEKILVSADALTSQEGRLQIANPRFTLDMKAAYDSVRKIRSLHPQKIICFHGGLVSEKLEEQISKVLEGEDSPGAN